MAKKALNERRGLISYLLPFAFCLLPSLAFSQEILVSTPIHSQYYGATLPLFRLTPGGGQTGNEQEWLNQAGVVTTYVDANGVLHALNGGGISSINGLFAFAQFDVVCATGLDFNIQDSIDTHSFCIPDASATARGLVTTGAQIFGGDKTFLGAVAVDSLDITGPDVVLAFDELDCSTATPTAGVDILCADQTAHQFQVSNNGGAFANIGGFPQLDQVLDPTADKTFTMGSHRLTFNWTSVVGPGYSPIFKLQSAPNDNTSGPVFEVDTGTGSNGYGMLVEGSVALNHTGAGGWDYGINTDLVGQYIYGNPVINSGTYFETAALELSWHPGGTATWQKGSGLLIDSISTTDGAILQSAYGVQIQGQLAGSLHNYSIYSDQPAAVNSWAFYGAGSADSYLGGRVTVKSNPARINSVTFTGAGLNDATSGGTYTGLDDLAYCVQIDASVPSPDTLEWGTGGSCSNGATGVGITGAAQNLGALGAQITFAAIDGHTIGNNWTFTAYAPIPLTLQDHNGNITAKVRETGDVLGRRFFANTGTALVAGDFVPSGGWGNAGSVAVTSASSDQSFHITVTAAGAGQGLNPTVAFTFKDLTWTTVPVYVCSMETGGTGALSFFTPDNTSATVLTLTYAGTPIVNLTYELACNAWGH